MTLNTKLGLHSNLLESQYSTKQALAVANEVGYDGYEIDIGAYDGTVLQGGTQEWTGVRTAEDLLGEMGDMVDDWAQGSDIELNSLCLGSLWKYNLAARREAEVELAVSACKNAIRAAATLGSSVVLLPIWTPEGVPAAEARRNLVAALREPLELAEYNGVILALENVPQLSNIVAGSSDLIKVVDRVDSEYCSLYYDVANACMAGFNPAAEIRAVGRERIAQIHLKDADLQTNDTLAVGEGDLDFEAIRDALADIEYDGYLTVESGSGFIRSSESNRARAVAKESVATIESIGLR